MKRRRFLLQTLASAAAVSAAGRLVARRDARRLDPAIGEPLGAIRGHPRHLRGPRASRLYTEWFPGSGAGTIVFTHGWCLTEAVWHYQKRDLAGGDHGLVTWDLPGHGHSSSVGSGNLSLSVAADALGRVVDEYADGGVILVGHSLGGVITLSYLARPEAASAVRGAVLVSTPMMHVARSIAGRWPGAVFEARVLGRIMESVVGSELTDRFLKRDLGEAELHRLSYLVVRLGFGKNPSPSHVRFIRDAIASVSPRARADTYRLMAGYDATKDLPKIKTPTLVVIGGRDRLVNPEESIQLGKRLPRAQTLRLPEEGHATFLTAHERFTAELRKFAARRLAPRRTEAARR